MTTNANAPVDHKHRDDAAKMLGFRGWHQVIADYPSKHEIVRHSVNLHAQTLANNEALNNRLAEIDQIAHTTDRGAAHCLNDIRALASGHTPSPCPSCAAKDEAMAAFKADVSEACADTRFMVETHCDTEALALVSNRLNRFIIPPADPVAEALKAVLAKWHSNELEVSGHEAEFFEALAELKSRLPLGGAK